MRKLYFSLSSKFLFLTLWQNNHCLVKLKKENVRRHSENFLIHLQQILKKYKFSLASLDKVYFTSFPSGQTGLRVSLAFLATWQTLNPQLQIYHLDTLLLQAGDNKCLSLLTIDSQSRKYYVAAYQQKKILLPTQIVTKEQLEKLNEEFFGFLVLKDFDETDFFTNFQKLENDFIRLREIKEIISLTN